MLSGGIKFTNLLSDDIIFGPDTPYTIEEFEVEVDDRVIEDRERMEQHALWPTKSYMGGAIITYGGAILADDSDDYNSKRKLLVATLRGDPDDLVTQTKTGILALTLDGEDEDWLTDVAMKQFSSKLDGTSPMFSEYLVTFRSWTPWFVGSVSGNKYFYS